MSSSPIKIFTAFEQGFWILVLVSLLVFAVSCTGVYWEEFNTQENIMLGIFQTLLVFLLWNPRILNYTNHITKSLFRSSYWAMIITLIIHAIIFFFTSVSIRIFYQQYLTRLNGNIIVS